MRSTICDLQQNRFHFIPNTLYDLLTEHAAWNIADIKKQYGNEHDDVIDEYYNFLTEHEYGFFTDRKTDWFVPLEMEWDAPSLITNMIVDCDALFDHDWDLLLPQINELGVVDIQIRQYGKFEMAAASKWFEMVSASRIKSVEWVALYDDTLPQQFYQPLLEYGRLRSLTLFGAESDELLHLTDTGFGNVFTVRQIITDESHCGIINPASFMVNMDSFMEAKRYNSCLNRKLSIDKHGDLCNCPSLPTRYGHIHDVPLKSVLDTPTFTSFWEITKDQINVCKDCEFRYVCSDCRAYTSNDGQYDKPLKCTYDPQKMTWAS